MPRAPVPGFSGRVHTRGMQRKYSRSCTAEREAVLILILFMLLIIVLLYFS